MTIITLFFAIALIYVTHVLGQPNTKSAADSTEINWLQVVISSTLIATAISAVVNFVITIRKLTADHKSAMKQIQKNHENTLNQFELQRQVDSIKEKVQVYSFFIFNLDRMIWNPDFREGKEEETKLTKTVEEIDNEIKAKYYQLNPEVLIRWLLSRHELKSPYPVIQLKYSKEIVKKVIEIRNALVEEYNDTINTQYTQITRISIHKIKPEQIRLEDL